MNRETKASVLEAQPICGASADCGRKSTRVVAVEDTWVAMCGGCARKVATLLGLAKTMRRVVGAQEKLFDSEKTSGGE